MRRFWIAILVYAARSMVGKHLWAIVADEVSDQDWQQYASGEEKRREVKRVMGRANPDSEPWLVNLAIETLVAQRRAG